MRIYRVSQTVWLLLSSSVLKYKVFHICRFLSIIQRSYVFVYYDQHKSKTKHEKWILILVGCLPRGAESTPEIFCIIFCRFHLFRTMIVFLFFISVKWIRTFILFVMKFIKSRWMILWSMWKLKKSMPLSFMLVSVVR